MSIDRIQKAAVIGAGSMGHQISMLCALGGFETYLQDIDETSLRKAREQLEHHMDRWISKGKLTTEKRSSFRETAHDNQSRRSSREYRYCH